MAVECQAQPVPAPFRTGVEAYWLADLGRSHFLYMSAGFEALWQVSLEALHREPHLYLTTVHPDDRGVLQHDTAFPPAGRRQRRFRLLLPDGSVRHVAECTFSMISPCGGEPRLAGVVFELPDAEVQLGEDWLDSRDDMVDALAELCQRSVDNDENLRRLFADASTAVVVLDAEGYVCEWNREAERLLGWQDAEALGRKLAALVVPAALEARFHEWLSLTPHSGMAMAARPLEFTARHCKGHSVPVELSGWHFQLSGLSYVGITLRDMTRQHVAEQVLYEHMERARLLFEFANIAMVVMDGEGCVIDWNVHAEQIFGYSGEQVVGRNLLALLQLPRERLPAGLFSTDGDADPAPGYTLELAVPDPNGSVKQVEASFWRFSTSQQGFVGAFFRDISARVAAESALRLSEEHYRLVIDNVRDGIIVVQRQRIVLANPRACDITGYCGADLAGLGLSQLVHPDDQAALVRYRRRVERDGQEPRQDLRIVNQQGEIVWLSFGLTQLQWLGKPASLVFFTDITQRKRLEDDLTATLRERETILDNSIVGIAFSDSQGDVRWVNRTAAEMFHASPEAMQGNSLARFYAYMDDFLRSSHEAAQAFAAGRAYATEMKMQDGTGRAFWVQLSGKPVDPEQVERGTVWVMMDINRRKELEFELLRTHGEREAILQSALVGMAFVVERRLMWINRTFATMLGYREEELLGKSTRLYFRNQEEFEAFGEEAYAVLASGQNFVVEQLLYTKSGKPIWAQMNGTCVEKGRPEKGSIWSLLDVSERHNAEQEIRDALAKQQELNILKTRFVSMTSHEFRTPLASVLSSAQLLRHYHDRLPPSQRDELLETITSSVQRMTDMLDNILLIGRVESNRVEFAPQTLDLSQFCQILISETVQAASARGEPVRAQVKSDIRLQQSQLALDEKLLRQILGNLLGNAIKYSPSGGEIQFTASSDEQAVCFEVADQGIGIPASDLPHLFDAFHRAQNVGQIAGTGLGLAIVRKSVELHRGEIRVESEEGRGTRFVVTLPLRPELVGEDA